MQVKSREELKQELDNCKSQIAVKEQQIKDLSTELGVEPDIEAITSAIKEAQEEYDKVNKEFEDLMQSLSDLDSYSNEDFD